MQTGGIGMWIRSQDKKVLVKAICVRMYQNYYKSIEEWGKFRISATADGIGYEDIGEYETEERALEVMDAVQNFLAYGVNREEPQSNGMTMISYLTFEMPKE
jgi:hypothetical protein